MKKTKFIKDSLYPKTKPINKDNLMSPPPRDSLLKALSPTILTISMKKNIKRPLNKDIISPLKPSFRKITTKAARLDTTKTSSKMTK